MSSKDAMDDMRDPEVASALRAEQAAADTEVKHTPGPWQASGVRTRLDGQPMLQVTGPKGVVAYVPYSDRTMKDHVESHADARMIAAAPDLVNVLQRLLKTIDSGSWRDRAELSIAAHPAVDDAREILAKTNNQRAMRREER